MSAISKKDNCSVDGHGHCGSNVEIHVNNHKVTLQRGRYDIATLKRIAGGPTGG